MFELAAASGQVLTQGSAARGLSLALVSAVIPAPVVLSTSSTTIMECSVGNHTSLLEMAYTSDSKGASHSHNSCSHSTALNYDFART